MDRRRFVSSTTKVTIGSSCGLALISSCTTARYVSFTKAGNELTVPVSAFGEDKFVLLNEPSLNSPIFLLKDGTEYKALSLECTHKQCTVKPSGSILTCPCHGAEFSQNGKVLKGPAERPLDKFEVITNNENIKVVL